MSKIEIKDLYLIFGNEKQKALKMLKKDKSKEEILKDTGCTVGVRISWAMLVKKSILEL